MQKKLYTIFTFTLLAILICSPSKLSAQFKEFTQTGPPGSNTQNNQNGQENNNEEVIMSKKPSFTIGRYFKALGHKDSMKIQQMFLGSLILPGTAQIYNHQAWKLPIVYGAIGGCITGAIIANSKLQSTGDQSYKGLRDWMIAGALISYWGTALDGVVSFKSVQKPLPARASLYSAMLPGLGQAYNGDYWKIPIFYGGFAVSGYCWAFNQKQYTRYRDMYIQASDPNGGYKGNLSTENIKWYRDSHRRLRDYSIIATALIYVLNIVDANVFAHFSNFDVSDDISLKVEPGIIEPISTKPMNSFSSTPNINSYYTQSIGLKMNLRF